MASSQRQSWPFSCTLRPRAVANPALAASPQRPAGISVARAGAEGVDDLPLWPVARNAATSPGTARREAGLKRLNVGLIGSGFMGRSHALAWRMAPTVFGLPLEPRLELLADVDLATAEKAAKAFGFARATDNWQALVDDPAVDLVDIPTPNVWQEPMALAAIKAGKAVYCEKPLAPNAKVAFAMADAAEAAAVPTAVGFNYLKNPM